jgi:hypothetical protein
MVVALRPGVRIGTGPPVPSSTEMAMYVVVQHQVTDPAKFWPADVAQYGTIVPPHLKLHHAFAGADGTRGVCVWEAQSVDALREWLDPFTAGASVNSYFAAVNKEGVALPATRTAAQPA